MWCNSSGAIYGVHALCGTIGATLCNMCGARGDLYIEYMVLGRFPGEWENDVHKGGARPGPHDQDL
eukprot:5296369-Pyramimonas_sp.AAC.1